MNPSPQRQEPAWTRLHNATTTQLRSLQHYFDRRHLEASLAMLLDAASGHEAQGLAPGASVYQVLHREADLLVGAYCERWQVAPEHVHAQLPALGKLRVLALPAPRRARPANLVLILLAVMLTSFLVGLAGGIASLGYHLAGGGR